MCLIIFRESNERHPESKAFRECYDILQETIVNQKLCSSLASTLYSKDLISKDIHQGNGSSQHVGEILDAIEHQIRIKPANFNIFINILSKDPVLETVCQRLQEGLEKDRYFEQVQPNPLNIPYKMRLKRYTGSLTGETYHTIYESFRKVLRSGDANEMVRLTQRAMADSSMEKDLKVFVICMLPGHKRCYSL